MKHAFRGHILFIDRYNKHYFVVPTPPNDLVVVIHKKQTTGCWRGIDNFEIGDDPLEIIDYPEFDVVVVGRDINYSVTPI